MRRLAITLAVAAAWPLAAQAQDARPVDRLQLSIEHNRLGRGLPDWNEATLRYSREWQQRELAELVLTRARRFDLADTQLEAGYVRPLDQSLTVSARLTASPDHRFFARYSLDAGAQYEFMPAWLLHGRLRHTRYETGPANQATLMLERYAGDYSASLAWRPGRALGERADGFELRANRYYRDDSQVGLIASSGDEVTRLDASTIAVARVRTLALVGRHRLQPGWSLTYAVSRTIQGGFYSRTGVSAGVQRDF